LTLTSLAMADDVGPVTVGTMQDLDDHDATRSCWGYSASETLTKIAHQHLRDISHCSTAVPCRLTGSHSSREIDSIRCRYNAVVHGLTDGRSSGDECKCTFPLSQGRHASWQGHSVFEFNANES